jgi:hypothetical protein
MKTGSRGGGCGNSGGLSGGISKGCKTLNMVQAGDCAQLERFGAK